MLAAGGTLLTGAVAGKCMRSARADARGAVKPWPVAAIRAHAPIKLPPLGFVDGSGQVRRLADYAGRGMVLNFWATWCAPCVSEMAALDALSQSLPGREAAVLAVSEDQEGAAAVRGFYAEHAIVHLPVLLDPRMRAMLTLRLDAIPTTLLIDPEGNVVAGIEGPVRWDEPGAPALISRLVRK